MILTNASGAAQLPVLLVVALCLVALYRTSARSEEEFNKVSAEADRGLLALQESGNGLWDLNLSTGNTVRSAHWGAILGYSVDDPDGVPSWGELVHPDDLGDAQNALEMHLAGQTESFSVEYRMKHKTRGYIWMHDVGRIVEYEDNGDPLRIIGAHRDITTAKGVERELALAQEEARKHAERQRLAMVHSDSGLWDIDLVTGETFRSIHWGSMLGYAPEEQHLIPSFNDLLHPDDLEQANAVIADHLAGKTDVGRVEYRMQKKNGEWIWALDQGRVVERDEQGKPTRMVGAYRDISELKEIQFQLEEARSRADAAAVAKSDFLAAMSHEIRTPMNGVIGMTDLLLDTDLTADQMDLAETVRSSGEALLHIINEILDFSKIEAGKVELEQVDFEIRTTLEDTLEILSARAAEKGLELALLVNPKVPDFVVGDPGRLRQVVTNLVGNAIKFTAEGDVTVKVSTLNVADRGTRIQIEVVDSGIGIPEAAQAKLFEAFTQADSSTTRKFGGTGLGLTISKQISNLMDGDIEVTSVEGEGSTFTVTVWFGRSEKKVSPPGGHVDLSGLRVLVVDDNPINILLLEEHLRAWEMASRSVTGAQAALDLLAEEAAADKQFDLALLDLSMPDIDGLELARRIKSDSRFEQLPLILLTSGAKKGDAAIAEEAGFAGYLPKPVRARVLHRCLESVVQQEDSQSQKPELITKHTIAEQDATHRPLVLLVEDNAVNQKLACRMLEKHGFRPVVAANGAEGLEAFEQGKFAAILMDCQMPVMDGYESTIGIREIEKGTDGRVPIIALTAHAMEGDRQRCIDCGMDDYLPKPITLHTLGEKLEKWTGIRQTTSPRQ